MLNFVAPDSIVRRIWGHPDLIMLIFAGAAAEFALNRQVDWLFFTGKIPGDPIGRFFSTVSYAQEIVFADEAGAQRALARINAAHHAVECARGQSIPDWAYRDVLYLLIAYSERSYQLLYRPLSPTEQQELYAVFQRVGRGLNIPDLPTYAEWQRDRQHHLQRDLDYSEYTHRLYAQYRCHLGKWRYLLLLQLQAWLVPDRVRELLRLKAPGWELPFAQMFALVESLRLQLLARHLLIPQQYWKDVQKLGRSWEI
jgi:hypothetical protein